MAELELPALVVESVAATVESARPLLVNRHPGPDETDVPINATIALELVDSGPSGIDASASRVWVDGVLAFEGTIMPPFAGPRADFQQTADTLSITLDPVVPRASLAAVSVRVVSDLIGGGFPFDQTYAFRVEDRTAPKLLAAIAVAPTVVRLGFDEPVVVDPSAVQLEALDFPAVPIRAVSATTAGSLVRSVSRATIDWSAVTISLPTTIGSMPVHGVEPWAPRPWTRISKLSAAAMSAPAR